MKNPLKMKKRDLQVSFVKGVSSLFGGAHFLLQSSADLVKEAEVKTVIAIDSSYNPSKIRNERTARTLGKQRVIKEKYQEFKKIISEAKERALEDIDSTLEVVKSQAS